MLRVRFFKRVKSQQGTEDSPLNPKLLFSPVPVSHFVSSDLFVLEKQNTTEESTNQEFISYWTKFFHLTHNSLLRENAFLSRPQLKCSKRCILNIYSKSCHMPPPLLFGENGKSRRTNGRGAEYFRNLYSASANPREFNNSAKNG